MARKLSPAEQKAKREQARLNKKQANAPAPRLVGKKMTTAEVSETPIQAIKNDSGNFEDIFLSIVTFLPPDQQGRALSLFSVFRKQNPTEQKAIIDSMMGVAKESVGPMFDLVKKRVEEDATYAKAAYQRQADNYKASYSKIAENLDMNSLRDKAKVDKNLGRTIRDITNQTFRDRAIGGVQIRRVRERVLDAKENRDDIDLKASQDKALAFQRYGQLEQDLMAKIAREDVLADRANYDTNQEQIEAANTLFLNLFENQFSSLGDGARSNIESGDVDPTQEAYDALAAGGTDDQRRARSKEENRVALALAEEERQKKVVRGTKDAVQRYFELNRYKKLLEVSGKDFSAVDLEMQRLRPIVDGANSVAEKTGLSFGKNIGQGFSFDQLLRRDAETYLGQAGIQERYGRSGVNWENLKKEAQRLSSLEADFGTSFNDLDPSSLRFFSGTDKLENVYGSTEFNGSVNIPVPVSRSDVLTVPTSRSQETPIDSLSQNTVRNATALPSGYSKGKTMQEASRVVGNLRKGIRYSSSR